MAESAATTNAPAPVMDVVAPPTEKKTETSVEADPVDQLAANDQEAQEALARAKAKQPSKQKQAAKQAKPTHQATGIGMAITATVMIVLGLAMLATYAYLQTNK